MRTKNIQTGIVPRYFFRGQVVLKDGSAVYGAHVSTASNESNNTVTDNNGFFQFDSVALGTVMKVSFQGNIQTFTVKNQYELVVLESEVLDEVVITSQKDRSKLFIGLGISFLAILGLSYAIKQEKTTAKITL